MRRPVLVTRETARVATALASTMPNAAPGDVLESALGILCEALTTIRFAGLDDNLIETGDVLSKLVHAVNLLAARAAQGERAGSR